MYHIRTPHASMTKTDASYAQDQVTAPRNTAPLPPFYNLKKNHCQALFHLAENFKQAMDPNPISPTIPIPITAVTTPRVPHYAPPRVHVSLLLSLRPRVALTRVPDSHLAYTNISSLKFNFSTLLTRHKNTELTCPITPKVIYSQHTVNLVLMK